MEISSNSFAINSAQSSAPRLNQGSEIIRRGGDALQGNVNSVDQNANNLDPEKLNQQVDALEGEFIEAGEANDIQRQAEREAVLQLDAQQQSQDQIAIYAEVVSEGEVDTQEQALSAQDLAQAISENRQEQRRQAVTPEQGRLEELIGNTQPPSTQPVIDTRA